MCAQREGQIMREKIYNIIKSPISGNSETTTYDYFMMIIITASLLPLTFKQTSEPYWVTYVEHITIGIFIMDYILRWIVADYEYPDLKKPFLKYVYQPMAIIDMLSIMPYILVSITAINPEFMTFLLLRLSRLARTLRSLKILKYSRSFRVLSKVVKGSIEPLKTVVLLTVSYIFISALIIFNVETDFEDFFEALYWATVSLTTVGYGDVVPKTMLGRVITMISSIMGIAVIALPSAIITAGYMKAIDIDEDDEK